MSKMWMVRAGEGVFLIDRFKNENKVVIGWEIGDLTNIGNSEKIKEKLRSTFPEFKDGQINMASQISKFRFDFEIGDNVISYDPQKRL